jgi:hypothetical protein
MKQRSLLWCLMISLLVFVVLSDALFVEVPGAGVPLAFFPQVFFDGKCGIVATSANIWTYTDGFAFGAKTQLKGLLAVPSRKPRSVMVYVPGNSSTSTTVFVAVADDGGGISFSLLNSNCKVFEFQPQFALQFGSQSFDSVTRAISRSLSSDAFFMSSTLIVRVGLVQGATGLFPSVISHQTLTRPLEMPLIGGFSRRNTQGLLLLQDSNQTLDGTTSNQFTDQYGNVIARFVAPFDDPNTHCWYSYGSLLSGGHTDDDWSVALMGIERRDQCSGRNQSTLQLLFVLCFA